MLLNSLTSLCQNNTTASTSTGDTIQVDTIVEIPISSIRKANVLMLERKSLLNITTQQDSIICLQVRYIGEQDSIISGFKHKVAENNRINEDLKKMYDRERRRTIIFGTTSGVLAAVVVTTILVNTLK